MKRRIGILVLGSCLLFNASSVDQAQKVYELIYQDIQLLKKQMLQFQEKLQAMSAEIQAVKLQVLDIHSSLKSWQHEQAAKQQELKDIPVQYQILSERMDQLISRLDRMGEDLLVLRASFSPPPSLPEQKAETQPGAETAKLPKTQEPAKKETPPSASITPPTGPSPQEIYNSAYSDYLKGNYDLAIEGFRLYREQFSDSPLADNALYWVGECYFSQKKFAEAMATFNEVILLYPKGDRVAASYLKKGFCLLEMGQKEEALAVFKLLVSKFPLEEEAKIAQQKIKELTGT